MAERHRSKDARKDTEKILGEASTMSQRGREGGDLKRDIATQDELKRANEKPAGATRVTGEDKHKSGEGK